MIGVSHEDLKFPDVFRLIVGFNSAAALDYSYLAPDIARTLLVDNNSTDDTCDKARRLGYDVLEMGANSGYSRAINAGLRHLATPFVLIVNPDLKLAADAIAELLAAAERYPDTDVLVPRLLTPKGKEFFRFETRFEPRADYRVPPSGDACISAVSGAALLVRRERFLAAGGFDENIFLYFEDDDLALRYRREKRPIVYVHAASAKHLGNASSVTDAKMTRLKNESLGWGWAYAMRKHGRGSPIAGYFSIFAKMIGHAATLKRTKLQRDLAHLKGYRAGRRGKPAPFPE